MRKCVSLCNFIEITLRHGYSPANLLHIFRTPVPKNTFGGLLLCLYHVTLALRANLNSIPLEIKNWIQENAMKISCKLVFISLFKVNDGNTRTTCGICSKLILKDLSFQNERFKLPEKTFHMCSLKKCFENMQQIYRRTPMPKCDFNKVAKPFS